MELAQRTDIAVGDLAARRVLLVTTTGVAAQIFAQPGLVVVPLRDTGPGVELGLVRRADSSPSEVIQSLTHRLAGLVAGGPMHV
ncbi:hypothetical protein [Streptomyces adustus]|uniref:hypothetical protein n=1 Tax=Streptomyces adustus TaxID=1609272 RepID=UPI00372346D7